MSELHKQQGFQLKRALHQLMSNNIVYRFFKLPSNFCMEGQLREVKCVMYTTAAFSCKY